MAHINKTEQTKKTFVMYGLSELYKEPDHAVRLDIEEMFRDILKVHLMGYIKETRKIGKYNNKNRQLIIELIGKSIVTYLLKHSHYFQGTDMAIVTLLDDSIRKERKILKEKLIIARNKGQNAMIRDN